MSPETSTAITWGTFCCLLAIGGGSYRAWKAGYNRLALVPIILLIAGLFFVPFLFGLAGIAIGIGVWTGRAFIPLSGIIGLFLFIKFERKRPV